jgi:hypothetical protein
MQEDLPSLSQPGRRDRGLVVVVAAQAAGQPPQILPQHVQVVRGALEEGEAVEGEAAEGPLPLRNLAFEWELEAGAGPKISTI